MKMNPSPTSKANVIVTLKQIKNPTNNNRPSSTLILIIN